MATTSDSRQWDELFELWQAAPPQVLWRRHSDRVNRALLRRWLPARCRSALKTDLWDEAVGDGLCSTLAGSAAEVVGIDASSGVVAAARARNPNLTAQRADVRALPFPDGRFDVVVSNSTLDHFDTRAELESALGELHRVLEPGGTLVLTLDNPANPVVAAMRLLPRRGLSGAWRRAAPVAGRAGLLPYHVGVTLGRRRLVELLERIGFDVCDVAAVVHAPRLPAVLLARAIERRGPARAAAAYSRALDALERLDGAPTRFVTGHFVAVRARRREPGARRRTTAPGSRSWTPRAAIARAGEVAREEGLRALAFRVLGETVYRRLDVFEYRLPGPPHPPPSEGVSFRFLCADDAGEYAELHPDAPSGELPARLGRGERCHGAWLDGALVGTRWIAEGEAWIEYLGRTEPLDDGDRYVSELYTTPAARGRNVVRDAAWASADALAAEGATRFLGAIGPENYAALRTATKARWTRIGRIGYVKLGRWRRDFGSLG